MNPLVSVAMATCLALGASAEAASISGVGTISGGAVRGGKFGVSVAVSGNTALVGEVGGAAKAGAAYLVNAATGGRIAKLTARDAAAGAKFGSAVAISGGMALVGATGDAEHGTSSGAAYLFNAQTGDQLAKLTPNDAGRYFNFGDAVGLSGDTAIVGAYGESSKGYYSGAAYLFNTKTGAQIAKLIGEDTARSDYFGASVAISGDTAIVGAFRDDDSGRSSGSAYLFNAKTGAQLAKLTASDGAFGDIFGQSVAISGNTAIIGAYGHDAKGSNSGAAYVFEVSTGRQIAKLTADDGGRRDSFGSSVAIWGDLALIGADSDADLGRQAGSAYLFDIATGTQLAKITAGDAAAGDYFGGAVALSDKAAVIGASGRNGAEIDVGAAFLYKISSGAAAAPVPLPATGWMLGAALTAALGGLGRRSRNARVAAEKG